MRLESSPGLWLLESVHLATYIGHADTRVLRPSRATDERGEDVTPLLSARDSRYLVTARGSVVAIEFDAPPLATGAERSILARTTGHYYVHTDDRAEPQREIVSRLMADRKFAQEYFALEWSRNSASLEEPAATSIPRRR